MRHIHSLVLAGLTAVTPVLARAQSPAASRVGFFFGMDNNVGSVRSTTGYFAGAEVAAVFSGQFTVGLAGYGLANEDARVPASSGGFDTLRLGYGGIRFGYTFTPGARFHPAADLLLGGGEARAEGSTPERKDEVVVIEPVIAMEATLARHLRASLGLGYRIVSGSELAGVSNADLSGLSGRLTLRVGRF